MSSLKFRVLLLIFMIACGVGAVVNGLSVGSWGYELQLPPSILLVAGMYSAVVLWLGIQVSRYRDRERRQDAAYSMNPLLAARTVLLAQAGAYTGATLAGWHTALLVFQINMLAVRSSWGHVFEAGIAVLAGLIMVGVGLWVENMCKTPPGDSSDAAGGAPAGPVENERRGYARDSH